MIDGAATNALFSSPQSALGVDSLVVSTGPHGFHDWLLGFRASAVTEAYYRHGEPSTVAGRTSPVNKQHITRKHIGERRRGGWVVGPTELYPDILSKERGVCWEKGQ
jgi:hypothetical protein